MPRRDVREKSNDLEVRSFESAKGWEQWLAKNHRSSHGIWLRFFKKGSLPASAISHADALDGALCYGWIDSQARSYDEKSWLQKFTPRKTKSMWSKRNIEHVRRLENAGRMKPAGLAEVEAAKADGRWQRAYDSPSNMALPADFMAEVAKNPKAQAFLKTLNKTNQYSIGWRLQTARTAATRSKRMKMLVAMLARGETFHPQAKK